MLGEVMGSIFQSVIIMVTFRLLESECEVWEGTRHSSAALVGVCHVGLGEADSWVL